MTRHQGTEEVEPGLYVSFRQLTFQPLSERGPLPGGPTDFYYRVPLIVMFLAAPLVGLGFVIFLPLIGFGMLAYLIGDRGLQWAAGAAREATRVVRPGWEPSLAFLSRSKSGKTANAPEDRHAEKSDEWSKSVEKKLNGSDHHAS